MNKILSSRHEYSFRNGCCTRAMPTIALLATLVLCACGGGGGNSNTATLAAPNLTNASAQFFTLNAPIPEVVFANSGGSVATTNGCSVDTSDGKPMLPGGLMLASVVVDGKTTCQISGALTEAIAAPVTVSITATNATGFDTATVSIAQTFMPALNLSFVSRDRFTFAEFDNPGNQESPDEIMVEIMGASLYQGELSTYDGFTVPVYAVLDPDASVDRILVQINGGTGTDARFFLNNRDHKAVVMLSMRGLSRSHLSEECALGTGLAACLNQLSFLNKINPRDNGKDVVDMMRAILGTQGSFEVEQMPSSHSFFGVGDKMFNIDTGSYGATILAYALNDANLPAIGRIFIEGASSPSEYVISDGFRNSKLAFNNLVDALEFTPAQRTGFLNALKARHSAPNTDCAPPNPAQPDAAFTKDCLASSMIWAYMFSRFEGISEDAGRSQLTDEQIGVELTQLRDELVAIPATEVMPTQTDAFSAIEQIYRSRHAQDSGTALTWEDSRFDLLSMQSSLQNEVSYGFTSRIGQICSAYVNRVDGDSQARFDQARADPANDPFWYGFLISYRDMLTICPAIADNVRAGITIPPDSLDVTVEALVQYNAGLDEKHHSVDLDEMQSYISTDSLIRRISRDDALQGHVSPFYRQCLSSLIATTFTTPLATLEAELDRIMASDCGVQAPPSLDDLKR